MLNLLTEWLKKNVTVWFSKKLFAILLSVLPMILYQVNRETINLSCDYVPNLVQQYTPFPPPWKCDPPTKIDKCEKKKIVIDYGTHRESFYAFCSNDDEAPGQKKSSTKDSKVPEIEEKRKFVEKMFLDTWQHYEKHAWGYIGVAPVTNQPIGVKTLGDTIVASMSTLWVMNLRDEFERGKVWIQQNMDLKQMNIDFRIWATVLQYVGGLLSCYALTGDRMFVEKASEIAQILQPAYASRTGLPYLYINPTNSKISGSQIFLSHVGEQLLEHTYLFNLTNDRAIEKRIESFWKFVRMVEKPKGLYMWELDVESGNWTVTQSTLWGAVQDFYFNLAKSYIQTGDMEALRWYSDAMEAVDRNGIIQISALKHQYYAALYDVVDNVHQENIMLGTGCGLGAMYALGANALNHSVTQSSTTPSQVDRHMQLARELTETCHQTAAKTKTGLIPKTIYLDDEIKRNIEDDNDQGHQLWDDLAGSYFILWRLTHEEKYRDYAWQMVQAIHRHCRTESGSYSNIENVDKVPTVKENSYSYLFLSATLKYLYLIFTDDSVLPLDKWIFNSHGHPLPIM